jgi:hypothetical protein
VTAQYLRQVSLVVADGIDGLDLSQLHIKFQIRQFDLQTNNTCQIRVYNVSDNTAQLVQKEFSRVILQGGYEGSDIGTIFDGTLVQVRRGRESPVDTYLDISGSDGDLAGNFSIISTALAAGSSFSDRVSALTSALSSNGVTSGYVAPLPSGTLPRGKTMFGMARDHLRDLAFATDTKWSIQNGQLQIIPLEGYLPDEAVVLTSATGMIGLPEQTQDGIKVRCLLNPKIKIGAQVQIDNASIQQAQLSLSVSGANANAQLPSIADDGFYRVVVCEHSGDTRGNEWYSDLICIALGQGVTPGLVSRGYT